MRLAVALAVFACGCGGVSPPAPAPVAEIPADAKLPVETYFPLSPGSQWVYRIQDLRKGWTYRNASSYTLNSYGKPALVMQTLEGLLGEETMVKVLRTYARRHRFAHPTTEDFLAVVDEVTGGGWRSYFNETFFSGDLCDYAVEVKSGPARQPAGFLDGKDGARVYQSPSREKPRGRHAGPFESQVTVVRHGPRSLLRVRTEAGDVLDRDLDEIAAFVTEEQNPSNTKRVAGVEAFLPSPLLASGLCLVDTPGVGSVIAANTEATRSFVPHVDAALVVPEPNKTLREGAIAPWAHSSSKYYEQTIDSLARHYKFSTTVPWKSLPAVVASESSRASAPKRASSAGP